MRTAHYNGFGNVRNLCAFFGIVPRRWMDVLSTTSPLLDIIAQEAPRLIESLRKASYSKEPGRMSFQLAGVQLPLGSCPGTWSYCPQCIIEGHSPIFHDIRDIQLCLLHGTQLIMNCPACNIKQAWQNANYLTCQCGFDRRTANQFHGNFMPPVKNPFESKSAIKDISGKYEIAEACAALWQARQYSENHANCSLPERVIEHIDMTVAAQVERYPGFIRSLHMAPWVCHASTTVAWLASRAMDRHYTDAHACPQHDCCRFATIDHQYAWYAVFGDHALIHGQNKFFARNWMSQQSPHSYSSPPRCQVIREAQAETRIETPVIHLQGVTKDEAATLLKCRRSTIDELLYQGWLNRANGALAACLPNLLDQAQATRFSQKYLLLDEACTTLDLPYVLCEKILSAMDANSANYYSTPTFYLRLYALTMLDNVRRMRNPELAIFIMPSEQTSDEDCTANRYRTPASRRSKNASDISSLSEREALHPRPSASRLFNIDEMFKIFRISPEKGTGILDKAGVFLPEVDSTTTTLSFAEVVAYRNMLFKDSQNLNDVPNVSGST
ncbi:hypothetical protein [Pseudomonas japonica]|nr:hypothetical protein [Pseudomonas japonica]